MERRIRARGGSCLQVQSPVQWPKRAHIPCMLTLVFGLLFCDSSTVKANLNLN